MGFKLHTYHNTTHSYRLVIPLVTMFTLVSVIVINYILYQILATCNKLKLTSDRSNITIDRLEIFDLYACSFDRYYGNDEAQGLLTISLNIHY